jgi:hypothetical protein
MQSKSTTSRDHVDTEVRPRTATEGRRRRPSTKAKKPVVATTAELKTVTKKPRMLREDKREAPQEMETNARAKNRHADGTGTRGLEASNPSKRPSRKSTRGGANRVKPDSQQRRQQTRALRSPESRHSSRAG